MLEVLVGPCCQLKAFSLRFVFVSKGLIQVLSGQVLGCLREERKHATRPIGPAPRPPPPPCMKPFRYLKKVCRQLAIFLLYLIRIYAQHRPHTKEPGLLRVEDIILIDSSSRTIMQRLVQHAHRMALRAYQVHCGCCCVFALNGWRVITTRFSMSIVWVLLLKRGPQPPENICPLYSLSRYEVSCVRTVPY